MNLTPEERADSIYHRRDEWRDIYEGTIDYEDLVAMIAGEIKGALNDMKGEKTTMPEPEQTTIKDICIYCGDRDKDHVCQDKRTVMVALREDLEDSRERLITVEKGMKGHAGKIDALQKEIERLNGYITNHMISRIEEQIDRFNTTGSPSLPAIKSHSSVGPKDLLKIFLPGTLFVDSAMNLYLKTNQVRGGDLWIGCILLGSGSITYMPGNEEIYPITLSVTLSERGR